MRPPMVSRKRSTRSRAKRPAPKRVVEAGPRALQYKVVELSNVDEGALERTLNEWVSRGWRFESVQFAMRESSKRPSMGFVFFTREGAALTVTDEPQRSHRGLDEAQSHLERITRTVVEVVEETPADPWERLRAFADDEGAP